MIIKIHNSLTDQMEEFIPKNKKHVNMYVCGPTVYNDLHIGNARPIITFDLLYRFLNNSGYVVKYASNITDIDDKIIDRSIEMGIDEIEVANINT